MAVTVKKPKFTNMIAVRASATSRAVTRSSSTTYGTMGDLQSPQTVPRSEVPLLPVTSQRSASYYPEITPVSELSASVNPVPTDEEIDEYVAVFLEDSRSHTSSYYGSLGDWLPSYMDMPMSHQKRQRDVPEDPQENRESSRCCLAAFCILVPLVIAVKVASRVIYLMAA